MNPSDQPRGDFVAFINRDKRPGDRQPMFEGRLSFPEGDGKRPMALWAHEFTDTKSGEVKIMFSGRIQTTARDLIGSDMAPSDQVATLLKILPGARTAEDVHALTAGNLTIGDRQIVLFPNGFKDEAPEKDRPDYWGCTNPGDGSPLVRIGAWMKLDRNGHALLSGATSYPIPGKTEAELQAAEPELKDLIDSGAVSQGMPEKATRKRGGRGE